jgi:alpha-tubulin suppressor-like RCC1 family protein
LVDLDHVINVTSGEYHSCAVLDTGAVKCWGHNGFGQLGDGTTTDRTSAVAVSGLPEDDGHPPAHAAHKALAVSAGESHTCAIIDNNRARCWGHNFFGQLGNNSFTDSSTPVPVKFDADGSPITTDDIDEVTGVVAITTGQFHSCARFSGDTVRCWGQNGRGQLGTGGTSEKEKLALPVTGLIGVRAVTAGGFHTCVLRTGNTLRCWAYNFYGQLGAYRSSSPTPVTVTALAGATVATTGDGHSCGLVSEPAAPDVDQPVCWGNNANGELGAHQSPSPASSTIPLDVFGVSDAGAAGLDPEPLPDPVSAGNEHACVMPAGSGTPKCWGRNTDGELGNGTNTGSDQPVAVSGLTTAIQVAAGGELDPVTAAELGTTCARRSDGKVQCWGANLYGQLGNEATTNSNVPVTVRSDDDDDHLHNPPHVITPPVDLTGAAAVAVGGRHACALMSDETVRCWGRNADGQLGDGTTDDRHFAVTVDTDPAEPEPTDNSPTHFVKLTNVKEITAGARHTCARRGPAGDNTVWCWGRNTDGQLGNGTFTGSTVPVQVSGIGGPGGTLIPLAIAAGDFHTCARVRSTITNNTFLRCWGDDTFGQLGNAAAGDSNVPVAPSGLDNPGGGTNIDLVKHVSAGRRNTCAVLIETSTLCWGDNPSGQLGDGIGSMSTVPVNVQNLGSVGGNHIPAPVDDTATTPPATAVTITVLATDNDADGTALTVNGIPDAPDRGTVVINGDNTVTYTPNGNFCTVDPTSNTDTFDYTVTDGIATVPATVTVTVQCPNTAPTANPDSASTDEETAVVVDVLANDSDINADTLSVGTVDDPANGTAVVESNKVKYTPDADFFGTETFDYRASDGAAQSAPATVTVTVVNVNDAPVANDDNATTNEDTAVTVDVVANDTDTDSPSTAILSVTNPAHGAAVKASPTTITYTPASGYCGTDGFSYTLADGSPTNGTDAANVSITVTCLNDGPNAGDDAATTSEDVPVVIDVLANDTDPENDPLTISAVTDPPHGTAVIETNKVKYTPDPDFCGADDFGYTATDGTESDSALVIPVVVVCHNDPPVAADDAPTAAEDTPTTLNVLANDSDIDGDALDVVSATDPAHGTTTVTSTELVNYKPDADYCGTDTFDYTVSDNHGGTDTATVTVTVTCSNDAPVVNDIADTSLPWGETLSVPLGASDVDAGDGDPATSDTVMYTLVGPPAGASVVEGPPGTFAVVWTPSSSQVGPHTLRVRGSDGLGAWDDETFVVTVGKRATALTYTGPGAGQYSDPTTPSATLLDFDGNPVGGVVVGFTIGNRSGAGLTDGTGDGSATFVLDGPMGAGTVETTFAGNDAYLPSATSSGFTIEKEAVTTTYTGRRLVTTTSTSAVVELSATVAEEADASLGMGTATLQLTFTQVGGGVLCSAPVSGTVPGQGTATCTTSSLGLGSRAVVAKVTSAKYSGPVDVGAFAVAQTPAGSGAGGGRTGSDDYFAFQAKPVRKAPPAGDALHVRRSGGLALVDHTSTLGLLTAGCSGGKTKVCSTVVEGSSAARWQVDLATGTVTPLAAGSTLRVDATDATEPDGTGADRYGVTLGAPSSYTLPSSLLSAGNIRVTP